MGAVLAIMPRIFLLSTSRDAVLQCLQRGGGVNELAILTSDNTSLGTITGIPGLKVGELRGLALLACHILSPSTSKREVHQLRQQSYHLPLLQSSLRGSDYES